MAKLGFKDILMKYLKKDEAFKLKYVDPLNKKNFHNYANNILYL